MNHPIQPLEVDANGTLRFKRNHIVEYLLEHGGIDLNEIAKLGFAREEHEQFAQLIGYSYSGATELSYMSDEVLDAAFEMHAGAMSEDAARADVLQKTLEAARDGFRDGVAALYKIHPEDLT